MENMKIGVDIRLFSSPQKSGIFYYTVNLLNHLVPIDPLVRFYFFYNSFRKKLKNAGEFEVFRYPQTQVFEFKKRWPNFLLEIVFRLFKKPDVNQIMGPVDVFFSPHFFSAPAKGIPKVLTVHDLSFIRFPEFFSKKMRLWNALIDPCGQIKKAQGLIAVSESTRSDLIELVGIPENKIKVIYSGVGEEFRVLSKDDPYFEKVIKKYNLPEQFFLYLGNLEPRKNIESIIIVFTYLKKEKKFKDVKLVIAGPKGWLSKEVLKLAKVSSVSSDILFLGQVDEKDRVYLYNLARLFIYPSFFEGFGLPLLEAMACGVPVITSNLSSIPEVVGEAAIMIDPHNLDDLAIAIKALFEDEKLRRILVQRGLERAKLFSWDKTAKETLEFLKSFVL